MNWDAIGAIAEVVGVIAVVLSLIYVGFQVRQNTAQLRQDNLRETVRGVHLTPTGTFIAIKLTSPP